MARFSYSTATPIGQIISEAVNYLQEGQDKIRRSAKAVDLMSEEQMLAEINVDVANQAGFRNALNQLQTAIEAEPFSNLLPNLDQG